MPKSPLAQPKASHQLLILYKKDSNVELLGSIQNLQETNFKRSRMKLLHLHRGKKRVFVAFEKQLYLLLHRSLNFLKFLEYKKEPGVDLSFLY